MKRLRPGHKIVDANMRTRSSRANLFAKHHVFSNLARHVEAPDLPPLSRQISRHIGAITGCTRCYRVGRYRAIICCKTGALLRVNRVSRCVVLCHIWRTLSPPTFLHFLCSFMWPGAHITSPVGRVASRRVVARASARQKRQRHSCRHEWRPTDGSMPGLGRLTQVGFQPTWPHVAAERYPTSRQDRLGKALLVSAPEASGLHQVSW